ncbi:MAG: complex I subunit 1 family protein [Nitrososphaerota archaeon]|nr:NADH-quinone oxidoreductase subunit H [Candidatus Bathyarchaeota archaeon]MDW8061550.1 complex I subunit 1 family protein [Nitrososphaerota archaeon]
MDLISTILEMTIFPGVLFVTMLSLIYEWLDRKIYARLQHRYGPLYTGPSGILQPLADIVKLLSKEDIEPEVADKWILRLTPIVLLTLPLAASMYIPMLKLDRGFVSFEGDLVFILLLLTLYGVCIVLAAWASTNRFGSIGGIRTAIQLFSFEIPLVISLLAPSIDVGTLSIGGLILWQSRNLPFILLQPIGFIVAFLCFIGELERIPFDIPHAETELVAGWMTEFSGRKLALIRLSMDVELLIASMLLACVYLGGGAGPILPPIVWLILKSIMILALMSNVRALLARFRIDQVARGAWMILTPLALIQTLLSATF